MTICRRAAKAGSAVALLVGALLAAALANAGGPTPRIGLDHVPVAVGDLDRAADTFRRLGFSLKPGRPHGHGIRNAHIKFPDGSGLELITATRRQDALSAAYLDALAGGDGPAFLSLHHRDKEALRSALATAGFEFSSAGEITTLADPRLDFLFFDVDNRSPTDRPEHFAHANGAVALEEVWLAMDDPAPLARVLAALGATTRSAELASPFRAQASVFEVENGRVVVVGERYRRVPGRVVIGVVMAIRSAACGPSPADRVMGPEEAHGLWLVLRCAA